MVLTPGWLYGNTAKKDTAAVEQLLTKASGFLNSNPDSLGYYMRQGMRLSEELGYKRGIMRAFKSKGVYHWLRLELDSAMASYEIALKYAVQLNDRNSIHDLYANIGMVFSKLGDYQQTIEWLLKSANGADSTKHLHLLASVYNSLSVAYLRMGNYSQAKYFIELSIQANLQQPDSVNLAGAYSNFGNILKEEGNLEEARRMFDSALMIFKRHSVTRGIVTTLNNLSTVYILDGSYEKGMNLIRESLDLCRKYGFNQNEISGLINLAEMEYKLGNYRTSRDYYTLALDKIKEKKYSQQLPTAYAGLGELMYEMEDYQQAALYFRSYAHLKDSLSNSELANAIANTRIAYEIQKRRAETDLLAKNLEISELRANLTAIIAMSVVAGLLVLLVSMLLSYRRKRLLHDQRMEKARVDFENTQLRLENQQLKEIELRSTLETRDRELSTYTLHLLQKNELLNEIRHELKALTIQDAKAKSGISRILSSSSLSSYQDREWELFKQYFDSAYGGFFDKLSFLNPELTPYDKRLAALIRLELTGEQIASIMGISVTSVKVSKHRLKKKLDIEDSEGLSTFLIELDSNQSLGLTDFSHILDLISKNLANAVSIGEVLWMAAKNCIQYLKLEDCVIYEVDWEARILRQRAAYRFDGNQRIQGSCNFQLSIEEGVCGYVARTGETVLIGDTSVDTRYVVADGRRSSELSVPIFIDGRVWGVIDSENAKKHFFMKNYSKAMEQIAGLLAVRMGQLRADTSANMTMEFQPV